MGNKTFDSLGLVVEDAVVTTSASCVGANIDGPALGSASYVAVINTSALLGTPSATDHYSLQLEVSDAVGGTYVAVGNPIIALEAGQAQIGFTSEQLEGIVSGADYFRVTATKVNTAATGITYTAFISKV